MEMLAAARRPIQFLRMWGLTGDPHVGHREPEPPLEVERRKADCDLTRSHPRRCHNTSETRRTCPVCGGSLEHPTWVVSRCARCGADHDRNRLASLAILFRGSSLCGRPFAVNAVASWQQMRDGYPYAGGGARLDRGQQAGGAVPREGEYARVDPQGVPGGDHQGHGQVDDSQQLTSARSCRSGRVASQVSISSISEHSSDI